MTHTFDNTIHDLADFATITNYKYDNHQKIVITIAYFILLNMLLYLALVMHINILLVSALGVITIVLINKYKSRKLILGQIQKQYGKDYKKIYKITLNKYYMLIEGDLENIKITWDKIEKIEKETNHVFILTSESNPIIVPNRSFQNHKFLLAFVSTIIDLRKNFFDTYKLKDKNKWN
jgi:hypothetical protein